MSERPTALITGGTRGIGLGIARALARDGWDLVLCGTRPEADVFDTLSVLRQLGARVTYDAVDVSSREARARLTQSIGSRYGALHAIVNNAGRAPHLRADILDAQEESFEELIRTNLQGPFGRLICSTAIAAPSSGANTIWRTEPDLPPIASAICCCRPGFPRCPPAPKISRSARWL